MAEPLDSYAGINRLGAVTLLANGALQVIGQPPPMPPSDKGVYSLMYLDVDGKWYYKAEGEIREVKLGGDAANVPTLKPGWPPEAGLVENVGDWLTAQVGTDPNAIQVAWYTGRDEFPFAIVAGQKTPYTGETSVQVPTINSIKFEDGVIKLNWSGNNGSAATYAIFRSVNGGVFAGQILTGSGTYLDPDVVAGSTYEYYIEANIGATFSGPSNKAKLKVPVDSNALQLSIEHPTGYPVTTILVRIANPSNTDAPINYNWQVSALDGTYIDGRFDDKGLEPGVGVLVLNLAGKIAFDTPYTLGVDESSSQARFAQIPFTVASPSTPPVDATRRVSVWVTGSGAGTKIHARKLGDWTEPVKFELQTLAGANIETRTGSTRDEEIFTQNPTTGFRVVLTDAAANTVTRPMDAVSMKHKQTPVRQASLGFGSPSEFIAAFKNTSYGGNAGFNCFALIFVASDYMQESLPITETERQNRFNTNVAERCRWDSYTTQPWQGFNNALWNSSYDHTVPYVPGSGHPFDEVIREYYLYKQADAGRLGLNISLMANRLAPVNSDRYPGVYDFAYSNDDVQKTPNGDSHIPPIKENQYAQFAACSMASDKGKQYWAEVAKKVCTRYRLAINDGTIRSISFGYQNSGEEGVIGVFYDPVTGNEFRGWGDYSTVMRTKFAARMSEGFAGDINAFNTTFSMGSNAITAFNAANFRRDLLYNGSQLLQKHFALFQEYMLSQFSKYIKEYVYANVGITRTDLWAIDVGGWIDPLAWTSKVMAYQDRLREQPNTLYIKGNNNPSGSDTWTIHMLHFISRYGGGAPIWEVSPEPASSNNWMDWVPGVTHCMESGLGISCFLPGPDPKSAWVNIANTAQTGAGIKMNTYTTFIEMDDLDASGNPITVTVEYKALALDGKPYPDGSINYPFPQTKPQAAWDPARTANPGKLITVGISTASMYDDLPAL